MSARSRDALIQVIRRLTDDPSLRLVRLEDGQYGIAGAAGPRLSEELVRSLLASGLLIKSGSGGLGAAPVTTAWLKRQNDPELRFRAQHHAIDGVSTPGEPGRVVLANLEESPVAALARRPGRNGEPWLSAHTVAAAERLRRDFEVGQLQPRVTANWSASINRGRRAAKADLTDLTDMALAARLRFEAAMTAAGPELGGILADVCCFLKGLETVERERQWPARSAKLVLRLALESLARHYGLSPSATGSAAGVRVRHWGAEDYRPKVS